MDSTTMSWHEHIRQNMRLALPLMIGQLATIGIWKSDTITMGRIDSSSLAAGALASRFYQPFLFLALSISLAVGPLVGFSLCFSPTGVWGRLLLGLSVASLMLTMRMMRAMRRIRDSGRILLA